jgi:phage terminase large subunit-like protein
LKRCGPPIKVLKENPAEENLFRQLRLNQWVKQSVRWMPMETWEKCNHPVDPERLKGRVCYGGLDLSSSIDITAFVLVFPPVEDDGKYYVLPYFWLPEETLELRVRRDHVPYDVWKQQGYLLTTEGNVIHYGFIEKFIEDLNTQGITLRRSPLTAGGRCRWCRTWRVPGLRWCPLARDIRI